MKLLRIDILPWRKDYEKFYKFMSVENCTLNDIPKGVNSEVSDRLESSEHEKCDIG
jgi:hypothetical protein